MAPHLRVKTAIFALVVILSNSVGNLLLAVGMRESDDVSASPLALIQAIFNPWVLAGITLLILWMLARMTMLGWADLTYVLPVTALGYAISAALGALFLSETITPARWAGTLLIVTGTILVGMGNPHQESRS
jgi:drug/metabolite transporter (DMT)-like permease